MVANSELQTPNSELVRGLRGVRRRQLDRGERRRAATSRPARGRRGQRTRATC